MIPSRRCLVVFVALAACALGACGKEDSTAPAGITSAPATLAAVDSSLGRLVPADALALLYAPSVDTLNAKAKVLVARFDAREAATFDVGDAVKDVAGPAYDQLDRTGPLAVALSPGPDAGSPPAPTFILPMKDAAAAAKSFGDLHGRPAPVVLGRFLALSQATGYGAAGTASPMLEGMLAGDVSVRIDLGRAVATYRKQFDRLLGSIEEGPPGIVSADTKPAQGPPPDPSMDRPRGAANPMFKAVGGMLRTLLDSAERLDLALRLDGTNVRLDGTFLAKEGSALAKATPATADLAALATLLPDDQPLAVLASIRLADVFDASSSLMSASLASMPEERQASMRKMLAMSKDLFTVLGDGAAMAMDLGKDGLEGITVSTAKDPAAYLAKWDSIHADSSYRALAAESGSTIEALPVTKVDGVEVREMRLKFDFDRLAPDSGMPATPPRDAARQAIESIYGKDGMHLRTVVLGDRIVTSIGAGDARLRKAIAASKAGAAKAPAGIASALALAGAHPSWVVRADLRTLLRSVTSLVRAGRDAAMEDAGPAAPSGPAAPLIFFASVDQRTYRAGLTLDVAPLVELMTSAHDRARRGAADEAVARAERMRPRRDTAPSRAEVKAELELAQIEAAIQAYRMEERSLPESLETLVQPSPRTKSAFLEKLSSDPWGKAYRYRIEDEKAQTYRVSSAGPDGEFDTEDDLVVPAGSAR